MIRIYIQLQLLKERFLYREIYDQTILMDESKIPKYKVELHVHLDGSARTSTLWELANKKGLDLNFKSEDEFKDACVIRTPSTLENFLKPFNFIIPIISGDNNALERIAYEFCEDAAREGMLYVETRYSPQLLMGQSLTARDVVMSVNKGLNKGSKQFGVNVKSILSCIRGRSDWSEEVLNLCHEFKGEGVVGIDLCGDQNANKDTSQKDIAVFQKAASMNIHRTVHAGEDGPASQVRMSIHQLLAERIGHGYHSVDDPEVYEECLHRDLHFEACPMSSMLTGSVQDLNKRKHPIIRFAEDDANFSISRDDPTITQRTLDEEYNFLRGFGLRDLHFVRANFNAARSAFLPEEEKLELLQQLRIAYGIWRDK